MSRSSSSDSALGFTLLEVLVALVIFALAFGILAQIIQTGLRQSTTAQATAAATLLAQSQLDRIGVERPLEVGRTEGETPGGLHWRTDIQLAEPATDQSNFAAYLVVVTVARGPQRSDGEVTLTTLRIGPSP